MKKESYCRIFGIMAREAPVCVLFRRGPSKWTQLIKWSTQNDTFEAGSWFKGHIYERRSDVSPSGEYLIYFAASSLMRSKEDTQGYTYAWTAISRPPKYTAVALWPKGDCWHGGGLFESERDVWLNHKPEVAVMHPDHVSSEFKVTPNPGAWGEDEPINEKRIARDGWVCVQKGEFEYKHGTYKTIRTEIWEKEGRFGRKLRREILEIAFKRIGGPYIEAFSMLPKRGDPVLIEDASWADLDQEDRFVFARRGKLYRGLIEHGTIDETELIDLNENRPPRLQKKAQ